MSLNFGAIRFPFGIRQNLLCRSLRGMATSGTGFGSANLSNMFGIGFLNRCGFGLGGLRRMKFVVGERIWRILVDVSGILLGGF